MRISDWSSDVCSSDLVALIALTRFDLVNAAHGRAAGDALLAAAAARIEHVTREVMGRRAIVARVGGAEFLVADEAPHAQLMLLAAQLADQLGRAFPIGELTTKIGRAHVGTPVPH